jgi:membrane protein DedA with SNARE-associated domain
MAGKRLSSVASISRKEGRMKLRTIDYILIAIGSFMGAIIGNILGYGIGYLIIFK